jgi:hypothetical protein
MTRNPVILSIINILAIKEAIRTAVVNEDQPTAATLAVELTDTLRNVQYFATLN